MFLKLGNLLNGRLLIFRQSEERNPNLGNFESKMKIYIKDRYWVGCAFRWIVATTAHTIKIAGIQIMVLL